MSPNEIGDLIVNAALKIHSALGPGLLESAYEACLAHELGKSGIQVERQVALPLRYDGVLLDVGYRLDIWVDRQVIAELKATEKVLPIHSMQLLSYLRPSVCKLRYLLNFNVVRMRDGIKRVEDKL